MTRPSTVTFAPEGWLLILSRPFAAVGRVSRPLVPALEFVRAGAAGGAEARDGLAACTTGVWRMFAGGSEACLSDVRPVFAAGAAGRENVRQMYAA